MNAIVTSAARPLSTAERPPFRPLSFARPAFIGIGLITATINVLYLTGSFYMLEVYDRVIPGRSIPTLVGLSVLALALYVFQGVLDVLRSRLLARIGGVLDGLLAGRVHEVVASLPLRSRVQGDGLQPLRDLDSVRGFLASPGPGALFDLPWIPLYIGICFFFHPAIGLAACAGALMLVALTLATELKTRGPAKETVAYAQTRNALAEANRRNAEVLQAMGMRSRMGAIWNEANDRYMASQQRTSDIGGGLGGASKVARMALQSAVLGIGAYLVIQQQATAGIIIASSILTSRALAPVELAIANWKGFVGARQSWSRLKALLAAFGDEGERLSLPAPTRTFSVESVTSAPPGTQRIVVSDVALRLEAGQGLGVIGPSASGKSSLARVLVGVWPILRGTVRLDGAALDQWSSDAWVAGGRAPPPAAGVHDLILRLPNGYETPIGDGGTLLSAGQRQRVALARALYGDPFLVVLDEPNSNLDGEGEAALTDAIIGVRQRGGIVVVIAHRPSALAGVDLVLVMAEGRVQAFGPRDEIMQRLLRPAPIAGGAQASAGSSGAPRAAPSPPAGSLRVIQEGTAA
jgi:PrtD family type I secretion system ABC transporter